ncbi:MAG: hypothetical protein PHV11_06810 [Candidatus Bipolaricaulis sp.]|nr:hypothetical protein [Candidatus Bipolaricaulis sp.]
MSERKKLTISEVKEQQPIGDKGAIKLAFLAKDGEDSNLWYLTFSKALFDNIKAGAVIDAEVEVSEREYNGNKYTDRKVTQIYKDGQPVGNKGQFGRGYGRSPEQERLIVRQTCLKCAVEARPGATNKEILETATIFAEWVNGKAEVKPETSKEPAPVVENKAPEKKAKTDPTQPIETKQLATIDKVWLKESLSKLRWTGVTDWLRTKYGVAGDKVTDILPKLTAEQTKDFVTEIEKRLEMV